jgi:flagellar biosynthesis/type III secretory pathway ATPase
MAFIILLKEVKMKKSELIKMIKESVAQAISEIDHGDYELGNSIQIDKALKQSDQMIDSLKALTRTIHRKQDLQMLQGVNNSLGPFIQRVTDAVRAKR